MTTSSGWLSVKHPNPPGPNPPGHLNLGGGKLGIPTIDKTPTKLRSDLPVVKPNKQQSKKSMAQISKAAAQCANSIVSALSGWAIRQRVI
jgi:hypothetical protein